MKSKIRLITISAIICSLILAGLYFSRLRMGKYCCEQPMVRWKLAIYYGESWDGEGGGGDFKKIEGTGWKEYFGLKEVKCPYLQQKQLTKIECIWVVDGGNNQQVYTIQGDTLYFDCEKVRIDEHDRHLMDSKLAVIDSLKEYRTGTCIENDAPGIIYRLWVGDTASEWISCFSENQTSQTDETKLINVLDKYFYYVLNSKGANMKAPDYIETFTSSK